jgi:hypothetical protein
VLRVVANDERDEVRGGFLHAQVQHLDRVAADRVHLRMKFDAEHAVAEIDKACAGIASHDAVAILRRFQ